MGDKTKHSAANGSSQNRIRILLVHNDSASKDALRASIGSNPDLSLIGETSTLGEAIEFSTAGSVDLVFLLLAYCDPQTGELIARLKQFCSDAPVLIQTSADDQDLECLLALNAAGYIVSGAGADSIAEAIRAVAGGEFWLDQKISGKLVRVRLRDRRNRSAKRDEDDDRLTGLELKVLDLVAQGVSNKEIAQRLGMSIETVKRHIRNIMRKLLVIDRTHAAVEAIKRGIL